MSTFHETASGSRTVIASRYEVDLDRPLGVGGMAMVYLGQDLRARRRVAVKTLRPEYQRDPDSRRRFRQEARMMAFVSHPNLVSIYDLHEDATGSWVVMEYVPGDNLKRIVERGGPLPVDDVVTILDQLAGALSHIHDRNLVHLDVKPQNVIRQPDGSVKLIDFGLAQPAGSGQEMMGGAAFGTVAYLAPEQASGETVEPSTDIYALGCVVYELLTGRTPFTAPEGQSQTGDIIRAHLEELPPAPSTVRPELGLPPWIDDVLGWALAKRKQDRFHDVRTFSEMFQRGYEEELPYQSERTGVFRRHDDEVGTTTAFHRPQVTAAYGAYGLDQTAIEDIPAVREYRPSAWRRLYWLGGKAARRGRRIRRILWRLTIVFLIGNLLLAGVIVARQGPSALVSQFLSVAPGTTTTVVSEQLNVRTGPSTGASSYGLLVEGDEVAVTGLSEASDGERWWPVETSLGGQEVEGWVWEGGLAPNEWTGRMSWMQNVVERGQAIRDSVSDFFDGIRSAIPGLTIAPNAP